MKKILVAILAVSLLSLTAAASNEGGKKKAKKKAKIECKKDNTCNKNCDPKNCDPKTCDPKNCEYSTAAKDEKCSSSCSSKK